MKRVLFAAAASAFAAGLATSCRVPNTDHCLHKAVDANAWCVDNEQGRDFCSPCEGEHHGCVKQEPTEDECPEYTAPPLDETGSGTETGAETGTGSDTSSG